MVKKTIKIIVAILFFCQISFAQNDYSIFSDNRIINGHSAETTYKKTLKFIISHRFGYVNTGAYELWGLDQSTIRIGFDYGITDKVTVGIGRSSNQKTYDTFLKYQLYRQKSDKPFIITSMIAWSINTLKYNENQKELLENKHRLYYTTQLLIAKKVTQSLSLQLMPTYLHRNIVETKVEKNGVIAFGIAGKIKLSQRIALTSEYYYVLPNQLAEQFNNSVAIGIDITTKKHVFQLHFSSSKGMTERFFITETTGSWTDLEVGFGFNMSRDFTL